MGHGYRHRTLWTMAMRYSGLSPMARHVGMMLATWADTDGLTRTPPTVAQLAEAAGLQSRAVQSHLATLVRECWLYRDVRGGRGVATRYQLGTIPDAAAARLAAILGASLSTLSVAKGRAENDKTLRPDDGKGAPRRSHSLYSPMSRAEAGDGVAASALPPWVAAGIPWADYVGLTPEERDAIVGDHQLQEATG